MSQGFPSSQGSLGPPIPGQNPLKAGQQMVAGLLVDSLEGSVLGQQAPSDRIMVQLNVTHENIGEAPVPRSEVYIRDLESNEERYSRRHNPLGGDWVEIPLGHLDPANVGLILIENQEGKHPVMTPTEEEVEEMKKRVVEVKIGYVDDNFPYFLLVPPGWSQPLFATSTVCIRCQHGTAKVRTTVYPK